MKARKMATVLKRIDRARATKGAQKYLSRAVSTVFSSLIILSESSRYLFSKLLCADRSIEGTGMEAAGRRATVVGPGIGGLLASAFAGCVGLSVTVAKTGTARLFANDLPSIHIWTIRSHGSLWNRFSADLSRIMNEREAFQVAVKTLLCLLNPLWISSGHSLPHLPGFFSHWMKRSFPASGPSIPGNINLILTESYLACGLVFLTTMEESFLLIRAFG